MMFYVVSPLNCNYLGRPCINKLGLIDPRLICINMFATKGAKFIHDSRCTWMKLYIATVEDCRMMSPGWWYTYPSDPSENYEFVSWDDEIPNIWKNKIYVPKPPTRHCLGGSTHANDFLYIFLLSRSEKLKRKPAQNWAGATFTSSTKWKWQGPNPEESYTTLPSAYVKQPWKINMFKR